MEDYGFTHYHEEKIIFYFFVLIRHYFGLIVEGRMFG